MDQSEGRIWPMSPKIGELKNFPLPPFLKRVPIKTLNQSEGQISPMRPYNHASTGNEFKTLFFNYLNFNKRNVDHSLVEDAQTFQNKQIYKFWLIPPTDAQACPTHLKMCQSAGGKNDLELENSPQKIRTLIS